MICCWMLEICSGIPETDEPPELPIEPTVSFTEDSPPPTAPAEPLALPEEATSALID